MTELVQTWPRPSRPRPIVIIGAGGIVRSAHLPAYRRLGYPVAGLYDVNPSAAATTADAVRHHPRLPVAGGRRARAGRSVRSGGARRSGAVDSRAAAGGRAGPDPEADGTRPRRRPCASARRLTPADSSPPSTSSCASAPASWRCTIWSRAARSARSSTSTSASSSTSRGTSGCFSSGRRDSRSCITRFITSTRSDGWLASRTGAYCRTVAHPEMPKLRDTRSSIILDYGDRIRCSLVLNHTHRAGPQYRASQLIVEGLRGAARLTWGVNLSYPSGPADTMEVAIDGTRLAAGAAARVLVHRGVRRTDVEPAAIRGRRRLHAGRLG